MNKKLVKISKFLSLVLRHRPESIGIELSPQGWIKTDELLKAAAMNGHVINKEILDEVVFTNDKQRFAYSADGLFIRANQGHSVNIDLALSPIKPPKILFHGTAEKYLENIKKEGLIKKSRHHVHLSALQETALNVGKRHGKPIILVINSQKMQNDGYKFYLSQNGVWLVDNVPSIYIKGIV